MKTNPRIIFWSTLALVLVLSAWVFHVTRIEPISSESGAPASPVQEPESLQLQIPGPEFEGTNIPPERAKRSRPDDRGLPGGTDTGETVLPPHRGERLTNLVVVPVTPSPRRARPRGWEGDDWYFAGRGTIVRQVADHRFVNRDPTISAAGTAAWRITGPTREDEGVAVHTGLNVVRAVPTVIRRGRAPSAPVVEGSRVIWTTRLPLPGASSLFTWQLGEPPLPADDHASAAFTNVSTAKVERNREILLQDVDGPTRVLTRDDRGDRAPALSEDLVAWEKHRGGSLGAEIMVLDQVGRYQVTTNVFSDQSPQVHGQSVVWCGWDGQDFEVFVHDTSSRRTVQVTDNGYDDVNPQIWDNLVVWEGYPGVEADVFARTLGQGGIRKLSDNNEDDLRPRVWRNQVVWQGYDGTDFEIYHHDGERVRKLTSNEYDDIKPEIRDGSICWMGFHDHADPEIFAWDGFNITGLTLNDYPDENPKTAGGWVIWEARRGEQHLIFLAGPRGVAPIAP